MRQVWLVFGCDSLGIDAVLSIHDSKAGALEAAGRERRRHGVRYARIQIVRRGVSTKKKEGRDA